MNANRLTAIIGAVAIVAVVALGWFLGISPLLAQAATAGEQLTALETQNTALRADVEVKKQQFADIESYQAKLEALGVIIPVEHELDAFYEAVNTCLTSTGAILDTMSTGDAQPYLSAGVEGVQEAPAALVPTLFTLPTQISVQKTPAGLVWKFVGCVQEKQPRLIIVTSVVFSADNDGSATITCLLIQVKDPADVGAGVVAPPATEPDPNATPGPSDSPAPSDAPADGATPSPSDTSAPTG